MKLTVRLFKKITTMKKGEQQRNCAPKNVNNSVVSRRDINIREKKKVFNILKIMWKLIKIGS